MQYARDPYSWIPQTQLHILLHTLKLQPYNFPPACIHSSPHPPSDLSVQGWFTDYRRHRPKGCSCIDPYFLCVCQCEVMDVHVGCCSFPTLRFILFSVIHFTYVPFPLPVIHLTDVQSPSLVQFRLSPNCNNNPPCRGMVNT